MRAGLQHGMQAERQAARAAFPQVELLLFRCRSIHHLPGTMQTTNFAIWISFANEVA
jgi:hypothetical protein